MNKYVFIVVGVGGTGSLLARDLPKLLINTEHKICLIDGDVVELKNMKRQSYQEHDINDNKAVALSSKINTFYSVKCDVISQYLTKNEVLEYCKNNDEFIPIIIGCVDNDNTRKLLENTFKKLKNVYYLDSANGEFEGNIFSCYKLENQEKKGNLRSENYQLDDDRHPLDLSCQAQTLNGNVQYLVTNNKMANSLLELCYSILENKPKAGVQIVKRFSTIFVE